MYLHWLVNHYLRMKRNNDKKLYYLIYGSLIFSSSTTLLIFIFVLLDYMNEGVFDYDKLIKVFSFSFISSFIIMILYLYRK